MPEPSRVWSTFPLKLPARYMRSLPHALHILDYSCSPVSTSVHEISATLHEYVEDRTNRILEERRVVVSKLHFYLARSLYNERTQMIYVLKGKLRVAFIEEAGGTRGAIVNDLSAGDASFFPLGLVHYQQNLECEEASYVAAVGSEDPGVVFVLPTFFSLPEEAIQVGGCAVLVGEEGLLGRRDSGRVQPHIVGRRFLPQVLI